MLLLSLIVSFSEISKAVEIVNASPLVWDVSGRNFQGTLPPGQSLKVSKSEVEDDWMQVSTNNVYIPFLSSERATITLLDTQQVVIFDPDQEFWDSFNLGLGLAVPVCGWLLGCWLFRRGIGIGNGALGED